MFLKLIDELSLLISNNLLLNILEVNKYLRRFANIIKVVRVQIRILMHEILI